MTAKEISDRILARLDDDAASPASVAIDPNSLVPGEILAAIAEGQELASWLTLCLEKTVTLTLPAANTFSQLRGTLGDYLVPLRIMGASGRIRPSTLAELDALDASWQGTPGTPARYVALGFSFFAVSPQPASDLDVQFTYAHAPAPIVGDAFMEIPEPYHIALIDYGIYRVKLKEGGQGLQRGMVYLNRYLDEMTKLGEWVRAKSRASRYDVLPFELALFDRAKLVDQIVKRGNSHA